MLDDLALAHWHRNQLKSLLGIETYGSHRQWRSRLYRNQLKSLLGIETRLP